MLRAQALSLKQDTLILSLFSVVPNEKSCLVYQAMGRKLDGCIFVLVEKQAQVWYTNCPLLETVLLLLQGIDAEEMEHRTLAWEAYLEYHRGLRRQLKEMEWAQRRTRQDVE